MQVAAVDDDVGRAVAALGVDQVEVGELRPVHGVAQDEPVRHHPAGDDLVEQPPRAQDAGGVGGRLQAGTQLAEPVGLFEHAHALAGPGEREGRRQAAYAAAHHDRVDVGHPSPPRRGRW